jgi:hypothetical protein
MHLDKQMALDGAATLVHDHEQKLTEPVNTTQRMQYNLAQS